LIKYYGLEKSKAILTYIYLIMVGNLTGNTIDAFEARLKGLNVSKGNLLFEFLLYILGFPIHRALIFKYNRKNKLI